MKASFEAAGITLSFVHVVFGLGATIGAGSTFAADRCRDYVYTPGGEGAKALEPEDGVTETSRDWHMVDRCD